MSLLRPSWRARLFTGELKEPTMTPRAEEHLQRIITETTQDLRDKYRKGNAEHGDDLLDMPPLQLVEEALAEALDQVAYLRTLKMKLEIK